MTAPLVTTPAYWTPHAKYGAHTGWLWQERADQTLWVGGGFASIELARLWWTQYAGTTPLVVVSRADILPIAERVKPPVWIGALSPITWIAWADPVGLEPATIFRDAHGQWRWDSPPSVSVCALASGPSLALVDPDRHWPRFSVESPGSVLGHRAAVVVFGRE